MKNMTTTIYSHAFLVGCYRHDNDGFKPEQLDANLWKEERISANADKKEEKRYRNDRGYNGLLTLYYKGHLDAMIKAEGQKDLPNFVQPVAHYICDNTNNKRKPISINYINWDGIIVKQENYKLLVERLHIFVFPLNTIIYAIEIDDTGSDLNELTMSHFLLSTWAWANDGKRFTDETKAQLREAMKPLKGIAFYEECDYLTNEGSKLKIFQSIAVCKEMMNDNSLYEIGTSSKIGAIADHDDLAPSKSYFNKIRKENIVSAFDNWKGLALMDSFTILGLERSFREDDVNFLYFPLIYLRCLFEKSFCFSRNSAYREGKDSENIVKDISNMERYYFYDNISYNFLPNLLYNAMAKGLGIKEEREEITRQIKEQAKEEESKRLNIITLWLAIFAIFSVAWDLCSMITTACGVTDSDSKTKAEFAIAFFVLAITGIATFTYYKTKHDDTK